MYNAFFGLNSTPFNLSPDPSFLYRSVQHEEALASLVYGVQSRKGFILLTGEVGTGKTLLLRCLLGLLKESKDVAYAYLFNGRLSPTEFLQYILADFGLPDQVSSPLPPGPTHPLPLTPGSVSPSPASPKPGPCHSSGPQPRRRGGEGG